MTFLQIFEKYNLTEKEIHSLQVMKGRNLTKTWNEAKISLNRWDKMIKDGVLIVDSYSTQGRICKVADFVHE